MPFSARHSAFAVFIATIAALSVPLRAQQADTTTVSATARPAEVQTKLAKQQVELNAAQISADGGAEARALNATGDVDWGVSEYQTALNAYNRAVPLPHSAKHPQQETAALNGIASCYRDRGQNNKAPGCSSKLWT